jgi:DNA-binding transcriptional ArsR family regulator
LADSEDRCSCRIIHQDLIENARKNALATEDVEDLAQFFRALADPTRLRILRALEQNEMCVCDLAGYIGVTESAISHQLRLLRQLRLVTRRRDGPILYYRLIDDHVSELIQVARDHVQEQQVPKRRLRDMSEIS